MHSPIVFAAGLLLFLRGAVQVIGSAEDGNDLVAGIIAASLGVACAVHGALG